MHTLRHQLYHLDLYDACLTGLEDQHMKQAEWQLSRVTELDLTSTELSSDCLHDILCRAGAGFTYLALGYCEFFNDQVRLKCISLMHVTSILTVYWVAQKVSH